MEELMDHFRVHDPNESGFSGNGNGGNEMDQPSNIVMRRNVVNEMDVPSNIVMRNFNIEVTNEPLETSSESCDSESNGSENDEREMDDEGKITHSMQELAFQYDFMFIPNVVFTLSSRFQNSIYSFYVLNEIAL